MSSRFCNSIITLFTVSFIASAISGCNVPNPFNSPSVTTTLGDRFHLSVDPAITHPGEKFLVKGTLEAIPAATVSIEAVSIEPSSSTPRIVASKAIEVPRGGLLLVEEFTAPSIVGTYKVSLETKDGFFEKSFEVKN